MFQINISSLEIAHLHFYDRSVLMQPNKLSTGLQKYVWSDRLDLDQTL